MSKAQEVPPVGINDGKGMHPTALMGWAAKKTLEARAPFVATMRVSVQACLRLLRTPSAQVCALRRTGDSGGNRLAYNENLEADDSNGGDR